MCAWWLSALITTLQVSMPPEPWLGVCWQSIGESKFSRRVHQGPTGLTCRRKRMPSEYVLNPPKSARVCGQWHLVVPHVLEQRQTRQETIELKNGTITHATCQTPAHAHDEPLSVPTAWATGFGIPREALRQACVTLTRMVQQALLMAPVAPAPAPGLEQTATKLTPEVVASAPEVTLQE